MKAGALALVVPVRDEADIIADMIQFHLERGVDFVVALDNGSADGTADILEDMTHAFPVTVLHDPRHENQHGEWGTRMVGVAASTGAEWVIAADADEFWWPANGDYRSEMEGPHNVIRARWQNFLPHHIRPWYGLDTIGDFAGGQYHSAHPKVAFTTANFSALEQGFHNVSIWNRVERETANVRVYHYPIRSYEQFEKKVRNGGSSYERSGHAASAGIHTRAWYEDYRAGRLYDTYLALLDAPHKGIRFDNTMIGYWHKFGKEISA